MCACSCSDSSGGLVECLDTPFNMMMMKIYNSSDSSNIFHTLLSWNYFAINNNIKILDCWHKRGEILKSMSIDSFTLTHALLINVFLRVIKAFLVGQKVALLILVPGWGTGESATGADLLIRTEAEEVERGTLPPQDWAETILGISADSLQLFCFSIGSFSTSLWQQQHLWRRNDVFGLFFFFPKWILLW